MNRMFRRSNILSLIGLAIIVYLAVIVSQTIKHNYDLNKQITRLQGQIDGLNAQQAELLYEVQYFKTNSYIDKAARSELGLMAPGEGVIVLPKTAQASAPQKPAGPTPKSKSNPRQWWQFLFG